MKRLFNIIKEIINAYVGTWKYLFHSSWLIWHHAFGEHEWKLRRDLVYKKDGREHLVFECVHCHRLFSVDGMISNMEGSISREQAERLWHRAQSAATSKGSLVFHTDGTVSRI